MRCIYIADISCIKENVVYNSCHLSNRADETVNYYD